MFIRLPTPKGVPHELHTNLPDNARSALRLELPQTKHLLEIITVILIQKYRLGKIMVHSYCLHNLKDFRK